MVEVSRVQVTSVRSQWQDHTQVGGPVPSPKQEASLTTERTRAQTIRNRFLGTEETYARSPLRDRALNCTCQETHHFPLWDVKSRASMVASASSLSENVSLP